ncbi:YbaN family protein [Neobacillus mesonae]|uniref:YbaN family protein n=1 Tax=Neobacillus mesonae TaxID=1193713 RepID=UPI00204239BE|nr:YbaN family protein [Neobacillus mesonae]MCM3569693.1 YbaN family protein [Neobacillus mesonae]
MDENWNFPWGAVEISKIAKIFYIMCGFIALAAGVLGIILPLIPTTPLLLLASFCFVKGSERFERWFKGTKIYKRHLESFVKERAMTLKQKLTILLFADTMILIAFILVNNWIARIVLILIVLYKYYYFIYKIKTIPVNYSNTSI